MSLNTIAAIGVTALIIGLYIIVQRLDRIIALQLQHRGCLDLINASQEKLSRQVEETNLRLKVATDAAERRPAADPALDEIMQRFSEVVGATLRKNRDGA